MCLGVRVSSLATVLACPARVKSLSSFALTFPEHGWGGEEQTHKQPPKPRLGPNCCLDCQAPHSAHPLSGPVDHRVGKASVRLEPKWLR
eukprot:3695035-Heterocapsa_arctica.AAC.1